MADYWQATVTTPVNIAVIKYWGKRSVALNLPTNASLSVTLHQDQLCTTTTAQCSKEFASDRLWLNGKEEVIKPGGRTDTCIQEMKKLRKAYEDKYEDPHPASEWHVHLCSFNNFPTAAGLASSASGYAALVHCLATVYRLPNTSTELSLIARQGSGSACRSLFGGFVAWDMGVNEDGSDSKARQVASEDHWDDINAVICVVSDEKKGTSSTSGMQRTVETSPLIQERIRLVPARMAEMERAIAAQDFDAFAQLTMKDSNNFHAVCLDTSPPIFYMNDVSRALVALVHEFNRVSILQKRGHRAAYTFDAGPNAVIYCLRRNVKDIVNMVMHYFPQAEPFKDTYKVFYGKDTPGQMPLPKEFNEAVAKRWEVGAVRGLIHTKVGPGPRVLDVEQSLLTPEGMPKSLAEEKK
ncbi:mevalonate pyrophosphate decarboxylase [Calocera cornea HHB12733]|uniref:Diphosphomevalonate decarboxylase n=1 Tax=Calocera cornea HHB12733 TaxID=1353952 RepID=A0A165H4R6_9BASI|nr:mevalonate pyrophosphate decarboxylase [Calocera cornea HHB12733]